MERLLKQLKKDKSNEKNENIAINLINLLTEVIKIKSQRHPQPKLFNNSYKEIIISADKQQLIEVIGHLIQNAQEATNKNGYVKLTLRKEKSKVYLVIADNGCGMSEEFIHNKLFRPFESTKGLSGMGIGVYQSCEYMRSLNGDIKVNSETGIGTKFTLIFNIIED
jgi:signal transduction histidine kinase